MSLNDFENCVLNPCPQDCSGTWGGDLVDDDCGVCGGDNSSCADCADIPNGPNVVDECGTCDDNPENDCVQDCAGVWGGTAEEDSYYFDGDDDVGGAHWQYIPLKIQLVYKRVVTAKLVNDLDLILEFAYP